MTYPLARLLLSFPCISVSNFHARVIRAFCERSGHDFDDLWYEYLVCFDKVKHKEGEDVLTWAMSMAETKPYLPTPNLGEK